MAKNLEKIIRALPQKPGVYFFLGKDLPAGKHEKGEGKKILYIGKAVFLRNRVRSYFGKNLLESRGFLIESLIPHISDITYQTTDSALEALLLEAELIKKYQPHYNTAEKDDKSFNYIVITKEDFPRVLIERGKNIDLANLQTKDHVLKAFYGPFPEGKLLKEAVKIIRKLFPFRDKCIPFTKLCFMAQIGLCPGVCGGRVSKEKYAENIRNIRLFLSGQKKKIIKKFEQQMKLAAKEQHFEKAKLVRDNIFALKHIQDVSLLKKDFSKELKYTHIYRIEAYDVAHLMGTFAVGAMVVFEGEQLKKSDYRKFKIRIKGINDIASLKEILKRRLSHHEWPLPHLIVVDGGEAQKKAARSIIQEFNLSIPVVSVVKDEKHKPKDILGDKKIIDMYKARILEANAESHRFALRFHSSLRDRI